MGVAVDFLKKISLKQIERHDKELMTFVYEEMARMNNVEMYGPTPDKRGGLISFNIKGLSPHDVAGLMDERQNIALRSGLHCVEPMHRKMGLNAGSVRASFYLYNTQAEVQIFLDELKNIIKTFC
jgi:cysteine desulfurase / selenocysteine lyase